MLERIVYVSRAAPGLVLEDVFAIIRTAHAHNVDAGISGGMVGLDGWFLQVLEGPPGALETIFGRIRADPRHRDVDIRIRAQSAGRLFPGQPMALRQRPHVSDMLLSSYDYSPGFPVSAFPVDVLTGFAVEACRGAWRLPEGPDTLAGRGARLSTEGAFGGPVSLRQRRAQSWRR